MDKLIEFKRKLHNDDIIERLLDKSKDMMKKLKREMMKF